MKRAARPRSNTKFRPLLLMTIAITACAVMMLTVSGYTRNVKRAQADAKPENGATRDSETPLQKQSHQAKNQGSTSLTQQGVLNSPLANGNISAVTNSHTLAARAQSLFANMGGNATQLGGASANNTASDTTPAPPRQGQGPEVQVVRPTKMNKDLRTLPQIPQGHPGFELPEFRRHPPKEGQQPVQPTIQTKIFDPALQLYVPEPNMPSLNLSFDGIDRTASGCACSPPDTDGDVGSNHYIQMVNSGVFEIWNKSGTVLQAKTTLNSLWGTGGTNPCTQGKHFGDGVVFYDQVANRWVLTDFAFGTSGPNTVAPYYECIAVSQTSDPVTGGWYLYPFQQDPTNTDWLGDYPKFGMWPDGWYGSYNMFCGASSCTFGARNSFQGVQVNAYDRTTMLAGAATSTILFRKTPAQVGDSYSFLPATFRFGAPPAGRNEFYAAIDSPPTSDPFRVLNKVHIWQFHVDFATPANSTFTGPTDVTVADFTDAWDSTENGAIVPQSGTTGKLDTVGDRLFMNLVYQNLGGTESLWATHTINDTAVGPTAIRWYQFNVTGNTISASPTQQGTWDGGGDGLYRWMPSLNVDKSGNMAIGYSISSSSTFPSIRYNGRLTTDTTGTLGQGESTLVTGTGAHTASTRWGDYSATGIDPTDGCTFWHTNEYMLAASATNWKTRVGSYTYSQCVAANDGTLTGTVTDSGTSLPISGATVTATSGGITNSTTTNGSGVYSFTILPGTYDMTATKTGYTTGIANGKVVTVGNTTTQNFSLTSSCTAVSRTWVGAGAGGAGTDFNTATNWNPNGVPQPCDNLTMTLTSGATITLSADATINNLTTSVSGNGNVFRLDVGTRSLTINGTASANVTSGNTNTQMQINVGNSPGQIIYNGDATFAAAVSTTFPILGVGNTTGQVIFRGNVTFNAGAGTSSGNTPAKIIFDAPGTQTITDNAGTAIILLGNTSTEIGSTNSPTVVVAGSASNFQPQGNLNVNGSSTLDLTTKTFNRSASGGTFTLNSGTTLKLAAGTGGQTGSNFPLNYTTSTLNATSTVEYNGTVAQTIFATPSYGNLIISNASTKTAGAAVTVVNDLTINSGATFAASTFTHNIGGNWANNGTFTASTSTINFNTAAVPKTISGSSTTAFNNVTVNKGTDTNSILEATGPMTMSGNLTLTNGLFKLTDPGAIAQFNTAPTIPSTAGVWVNGGTLNGGNFSYTNNGLIRISSGSATFGTASGNALTNNSTGTVNIQGGTVSFSGRLVNNGGTVTISGGTTRITTVGNASSTLAGFDMNGASNLTMTGGTVEFQNANSSGTTPADLKIASGAGTKSITGGTVQIGNASTPASQVFKINSAIPIFNLTINATNSPTGRLDTNALTVNNNVTISGGTLDAATNNLNMTVSGNWSNSGTYSGGSGAATVTFNGSNNTQTLSGTSTFNNLTINHTGTGSVTASGSTLTVGSLLRVQSGSFTSSSTFKDVQIDSTGTLVSDGGTMNVSGNWTNNGGTFTPAGGTVIFNSTTATQSINGTATSQTFNNVTVSKSGQTLNLGGSMTALTISNALNVSAGTFDQGASANLTSGPITVSSGATFKNLGTGDLTLSGNVSNGGTMTLNGSGTPCGDADAILIRSSVNGTQRSWSGAGTFSVTDVDVKDQAGTAIITVSSGTNSGNNGANWFFVAGCTTGATYTWGGPTSGTADWNIATNWTPSRTVPASNDVLIINTGFSPTITNVPTQTIAVLRVIGNTAATLKAIAAGGTLTISGATGSDLQVDSGSSLTVAGSDPLQLSVASGSTGTVSGVMTFQDGAHRLIGNAANAVTFNSGASFMTASGFSGNPFGTGAGGDGTAGSIIFANGSSYFHNSGASPFGSAGNASVAVFQTGSEANWLTTSGFQASGRTYANLNVGKVGPSPITASVSDSGTGNFQFDNLQLLSDSALTFNGSGSSAITIQGNVTSDGTGSPVNDLSLTAGTGGIVLNKAGTQTFMATGAAKTITFGSNATVNNGTTLALTTRVLKVTSGTLSVLGSLTKTTGYVIGNLLKPLGAGSSTFDVGTANGYSPVMVNVTNGSGNLTVKANQGPQPNLNTPSAALQRYWSLTGTGFTADLTFNYLDPTDISGTESSYIILKHETNWTTPSGTIDTANNKFTVPGVSSFSDWTLGAPNAPTLVKLRTFKATSDNGDVMIRWQSGYEVDNLGYNLYREQNGERTRVTRSMIAGSALLAGERTVLTAGQSYTWFDRPPADSGGVSYWLEDVDINGKRTLHGPVKPAPGKVDHQQSAQAVSLDQLSTGAKSEEQEELVVSNEQEVEPGKAATASAGSLSVQQNVAGQSGVKIMVRRSGWVRVTQPELVAAGLGQNVNPAYLQLYGDGRQVPIKVSANASQGQFSAGDWIEFYARGLDVPTTDTRTYYLVTGTKAGLRISRSPYGVTPDGTQTGPQSFISKVVRKERSIYFSGLNNGDAENFFGQVITTTPVTSTLSVQHLDPTAASARLRVTLQGVTAGSHRVNVQVNGAGVGKLMFNGRAHPTVIFTISTSLLREGVNSVRMVAANSETDISLVDTLQLAYARTYTADNDGLQFTVSTTAPVSIDGFGASNIRVMDITNPYVVQEFVPRVDARNGSYTATVQISNAGPRNVRTLLAFLDNQADHPAAINGNEPSSLTSSNNGADLLIITERAFRESVQPLAELRRGQGLQVMVVDVEDVYDEFSYGAHTPQAIRDFITRAAQSWQHAPHYVLLVGDATYDPRNYLGYGNNDLVPTKMLYAGTMETASDDWLADFNSDGVPELAIGRLPVRTSQEAATVINKIVGFSPASAGQGALLIADRNDTENNFEGASQGVQSLLPAGMPVAVINRGNNDTGTVHNQIVQSINQGPLVVNYFGHGSVGLWTGSGLLNTSDADQLTNGTRLPLFTLMTCLNGFFHDVVGESMAEALMKAPQGGAVAVWASSGLTDMSGQAEMDQQMYGTVFGTQSVTLGDAVRAAKAASQDQSVRRTWIFFGDPTTRLR
jgi:hypothetical protein